MPSSLHRMVQIPGVATCRSIQQAPAGTRVLPASDATAIPPVYASRDPIDYLRLPTVRCPAESMLRRLTAHWFVEHPPGRHTSLARSERACHLGREKRIVVEPRQILLGINPVDRFRRHARPVTEGDASSGFGSEPGCPVVRARTENIEDLAARCAMLLHTPNRSCAIAKSLGAASAAIAACRHIGPRPATRRALGRGTNSTRRPPLTSAGDRFCRIFTPCPDVVWSESIYFQKSGRDVATRCTERYDALGGTRCPTRS